MMWLALGAICAAILGLLFLAYRVWCGDFDGTPYPAMNGTKLEQAIREQLARGKDE